MAAPSPGTGGEVRGFSSLGGQGERRRQRPPSRRGAGSRGGSGHGRQPCGDSTEGDGAERVPRALLEAGPLAQRLSLSGVVFLLFTNKPA